MTTNPFLDATGDVIELDARRASRQTGGSQPLQCRNCGGEWFKLDGGSTGIPGAITLAEDGRVTGYHGAPICMDCGIVAAV